MSWKEKIIQLLTDASLWVEDLTAQVSVQCEQWEQSTRIQLEMDPSAQSNEFNKSVAEFFVGWVAVMAVIADYSRQGKVKVMDKVEALVLAVRDLVGEAMQVGVLTGDWLVRLDTSFSQQRVAVDFSKHLVILAGLVVDALKSVAELPPVGYRQTTGASDCEARETYCPGEL